MEMTVSWNPLLNCLTECIISAQDPNNNNNNKHFTVSVIVSILELYYYNKTLIQFLVEQKQKHIIL